MLSLGDQLPNRDEVGGPTPIPRGNLNCHLHSCSLRGSGRFPEGESGGLGRDALQFSESIRGRLAFWAMRAATARHSHSPGLWPWVCLCVQGRAGTKLGDLHHGPLTFCTTGLSCDLFILGHRHTVAWTEVRGILSA